MNKVDWNTLCQALCWVVGFGLFFWSLVALSRSSAALKTELVHSCLAAGCSYVGGDCTCPPPKKLEHCPE